MNNQALGAIGSKMLQEIRKEALTEYLFKGWPLEGPISMLCVNVPSMKTQTPGRIGLILSQTCVQTVHMTLPLAWKEGSEVPRRKIGMLGTKKGERLLGGSNHRFHHSLSQKILVLNRNKPWLRKPIHAIRFTRPVQHKNLHYSNFLI